ncbi:HNH endonuclease [Clostridium felsineum]|uniref:HNH endonuclease n=1 Tax=Clostridium felsineum TaxID=36839 RepID=UPI0009C9587E|nr:HNH endonuclease [Clostridium felsineum]URZ02830.1 hypothetical protein CLAUR_028640 [Clostridium felsineum]
MNFIFGASKAESLLGKAGTFSKSVAISSAENAKGLITLPGRAIDNLGSKVADLRTVISKGKGIVGDFTKSVVVSSAENAKSLLTKVKGTVSDLGTASAAFAKAFGKTYVEESGKYVNTCFSVFGAMATSAKVSGKAIVKAGKEAKSVLRTVKAGKSGLVKVAEAETDIPPAFRQSEFASSYESRIHQTPGEENLKVVFEGPRGESLCTLKPPPDPELSKILDGAGIDGIEYRNGVPDFTPVSKANIEIEHMVGGKLKMGTKARGINFVQADKKLAEKLNNSPELARKFGMEPGEISVKDIRNFRKKNKYTWHELNDCKTIQFVPSKINNAFGHVGGVGEINAGAFEPQGFANK